MGAIRSVGKKTNVRSIFYRMMSAHRFVNGQGHDDAAARLLGRIEVGDDSSATGRATNDVISKV